ncbi:MAG TPA: tetratricopeptide repeat protein [Burkholderiales bacterium]|nr:tetratricopeptide repeat protein [Burkholderiales bacterium]
MMTFPRFSALPPFMRWALSAGLGLMLTACAHQPLQRAAPAAAPAAIPGQGGQSAPKQATAPAPATAPTAAAAPAAAAEANLPKEELTQEVLYEYLLAEIAGQRGALGLSAQAFADLAKKTRDPRIAKRAVQIALYARMPKAALDAARIWYESEPSSMQALQALSSLLVASKREEEALPYLQKLLGRDASGNDFLQLNRLFAGNRDKALTLKLVKRLAQPYPKVAQAHFAVAEAAEGAGNSELALAEAREASRLKPDWELPVLLEAQLLQRQSDTLALQRLAGFLERHPKAREVRLSYARLLVGERKYTEARAQFQTLSKDFPDNADVVFAVGALSLQLHDYAQAEANFKHLLTLTYHDKNTVRLYLGQIAEEQKNYPEALHWYDAVTSGELYLQAQIRHALVLNKQGKLDAARAYLQKVQTDSVEGRVQLVLAESQMLRADKRPQEAFDLIGQALKKMPEQPDLLYDYAMVAEKLGRMDVLEASLKALIRLQPDHAQAYNALGYSLADHNERLPEAHKLIAKALQLAPDDPFIIDSMGWVLYRMGKNEQALEYLRKAYSARPDPEIAAHLGEVLWVAGRHAEAEKIWHEAAKKTPDNDALNSTIKRFKP